jgi:hypothetical protein
MSRITACDNAVSTAKRDGRAVRTSGGCFGGKLRQPVAKRGSGRRRRKTGAVAGTRVLGAASCMAGDAHACNPPNHRSRWLPRVLRKCGNSGLFRTRSDFSLFPLVLGDFFFRPSRNALLGLICDKISIFRVFFFTVFCRFLPHHSALAVCFFGLICSEPAHF